MEVKDATDWKGIFSLCCKEGDHDKTLLIIKYNRFILKSLDNSTLEDLRNESIREHRIALNDDITLTEKLIGEAVAQNLLTEEQYAEARSQIALIDPETITNFPQIYSRLNKVRKQLKTFKKERIKNTYKKLKNIHLDEKDYLTIKTLIDAEDIGTAEEFLEMVSQGESLPKEKAQSHDPFKEFFPQFIHEFEQYITNKGQPQKILNNISRGQSFGPVKLTDIRGAQLDEAKEPIRIWMESKRARKIDSFGVKAILSWLGFNVKKVSEGNKSSSDRQWFKFEVEIVRDGCPISAYGSDASGHYRLLCVHGRPPEDQIVQQVATKNEEGPCIVFYFGRMTERQFRDLSISAKDHSPGALFVDEAGIFYLLGQRGSKLNKLFQITLPFTSHNPYKPFATGNVPPEMFYGRSHEMQSIMDPHGACFIYGGRQLGKSALLRAVERKIHRPSASHFAFFVDLKVEGLGESRPIDDIWRILHFHVKQLGIVQSNYSVKKGHDQLIQDLFNWSKSDPQRQLFVLLDEADHLLDEDAKENFKRITSIKKIMDNTNRKIKFVFAGLHNVQRFSRIPNQPLAHLGAPICIGPLLNNGEWREATKLIEEPLNALGFRFEPRLLVNRILGHTNYQPSLIQLFCESLVRRLSESNQVLFDQKTSPPYIITEKHVDDAYLNTQLRKTIRERFELTLNLDPRYRFIAYVIAYGVIDDEEANSKGFSIPWITHEVNHWWPRGFADSGTIDDLRGLLDEMIGLGVLSKTEDNKYRLRSSNVLRLLGSQEDIEHTLLASDTWDLPEKFHTSIFRRWKKNEKDIQRSPVTGDQESDLLYREHGIRLVFGSKALGIEAFKNYIEIAKPDSSPSLSSLIPATISDVKEFIAVFNKKLDEKKNGLNLIFITSSTPFSERWVEEAAKKINTLRSTNSICRVFFLFDPDSLFSWLKLPAESRPENNFNKVQITSLKRWTEPTLARWLYDLALAPNTPAQHESIMSKTGGWPNLLYRFANLNVQENIAWAEALDKISTELRQTNESVKFLESVGLRKDTIQYKFMRDWAEIKEPLSVTDMLELFDEFDEEQVDRLLFYGENLNLCKPIEDNKWRLETLVANLLRLE